MAVDARRETFHITRVGAAQLGSSWLAQAHRPEVVEALARVEARAHVPLRTAAEQLSQGRSPSYVPPGTPGAARCLKTRQILGVEVAHAGFDLVDSSFAERYAHLAVRRGDLLVNRSGAGSIGRVGVYLRDDAPLTNEHLFRVRMGAGFDPCFVAVYLHSSWGQRVLERGITGSTGQLNLAIDYLARLPVPAWDPQAQAVIGAHVREAARLREAARTRERAFVAAVGSEVPRASGSWARVPASALGADLNPGKYGRDRLAVVEALRARGGRRLGSLARASASSVRPCDPSQRYLGLEGIASDSVDLRPTSVGEAGISGVSRELLAGVAVSRLRPYLNKVALIPPQLAGALGSTELLCVESSALHPGYLYGALKLGTTVRQLDPVATGTTHPRITLADLLDVVIPVHPEHEALGRRLVEAQREYARARALIAAARTLVERVIAGTLDERELEPSMVAAPTFL